MGDTVATFEAGSSCATRYPLLLVHGVGVRDGKRSRIWGRIPEALRRQGAQVYFGEHDAWGTPLSNAVQLLERLPAILAESGATKINVIAHSKGGVDTRHLINLLSEGAPDELPIASLTTIATPHHGCYSLEVLFSTFWPVFFPLASVVNRVYRMAGDENPDFFSTCVCLTESNMREFNAAQPSLAPVFSQQFAGSLQGLLDDPLVFLPYLIVSRFEGPNDGIVALRSTSYDHFRGVCCTMSGRGISHDRLVDLPRRPFSTRILPGASRSGIKRSSVEPEGVPEGVPLDCEDILEFYISLVADLKARGY